MKIPLNVKRWAAGGLVFLALLSGASALFIVQMDKMIQDTTFNTVQEIATHDRLSIENFLERNWNALDGIYGRLVIYDCESILAAQEQLGLERATGEFHTLYLVAEDGTVYNDRYSSFYKGTDGHAGIPERRPETGGLPLRLYADHAGAEGDAPLRSGAGQF